MLPLNLPDFDVRLKQAQGKVWIFDGIRKKFVVLTPEEWVRQHFIHYLIDHKKYPRSLVKVEGGLTYNQLAKRSDIVVFSRKGDPWMIIECKAPTQKINQETLLQAALYNATLRASYLTVTNGRVHLFASADWESRNTFLLEELPAYPKEES